MEPLKPVNPNYPGNHVKVTIQNPNLDFTAAKDSAKQKAKEMCENIYISF